MGVTIRAAVYLRMSSDDQTVSIARQESEIKAHAARNGMKIVGTYKDEGKSGSKEPEKRLAFQQLLIDSAKGGFEAVVCYNSSRFARLDTIDGAFAKQILRQNGICLVTVSEGRIDWNTPEGRMMDFMLSEQAHAYSRTLSKDSISGRLRAMEAGCWPYGCVPYGFDRLYAYGEQQHRVRRMDRFRKPRGWTLKLVVNEQEAAVVRRIFDLFVNRAMSMRQIAMLLNDEKTPPPDNLPRAQKLGWTNITVGTVLRHKAYLGIAEMGKRKPVAKTAFNRMPPIEKAGCCPAIVELDIFQEAQRRLDEFKARKMRQQSSRAGLLSGFLTCSRCGYRLHKEQRGNGPVFYVCESAARRPHLGCHQWRVAEREVLPAIVQKVIETVDLEILRAMDSRPRSSKKISQADILARQVEGMRAKMQTASGRYLTEEDADLAASLKEQFFALKKELAETEEALRVAKAIEEGGGVHSFAEWWTKEKGKLAVVLTAEPTFESVDDAHRRNPCAYRPGCSSREHEDAPQPRKKRKGYATQRSLRSDFCPPPPEDGAVFDQGAFRALLQRLGTAVTVHWKKAKKGRKPLGNKRWDVDFAQLKIDVTFQGGDDSAKHADEEHTGMC